MVTQGYRSWGGGGVAANDQNLRNYYNQLDGVSNGLETTEACFNLDRQNYQKDKNCPSVGVTPFNGSCPAPSTKDPTRPLCIYPKNQLTAVGSIGELKDKDGNPVLNKYYYDPATGWLFLNVAQANKNAVGPSPLGACTGDPTNDPFFCPSKNTQESYYVCPAEGCWDYGLTLNVPDWKPQPSNCGDPYAKYGTPPTPTLDGELVAVGTTTPINRTEATCPPPPSSDCNGGEFPHYKPVAEPTGCITPQ
jgi:hypothetical protein